MKFIQLIGTDGNIIQINPEKIEAFFSNNGGTEIHTVSGGVFYVDHFPVAVERMIERCS